MSLSRLYAITTLSNLSLLGLIYFLIPALRSPLIAEDQFLENLTAILFFDGFVLGLFSLAQTKTKKYRSIFSFIPLISLLGFLDEISFGQRLFSIKMPVVGGTRIDAIHDFNSVAKSQLSQLLHGLSITFPDIYPLLVLGIKISAVVLAGAGIFALTQKRKKIVASSQKLFHKYPPFRFLLLAASFGLISQLIDLEFVKYQFLVFVEELFEMNIALSMLFASFAIAKAKAQEGYLDTESSQFNRIASAVDAQSNQIS